MRTPTPSCPIGADAGTTGLGDPGDTSKGTYWPREVRHMFSSSRSCGAARTPVMGAAALFPSQTETRPGWSTLIRRLA